MARVIPVSEPSGSEGKAGAMRFYHIGEHPIQISPMPNFFVLLDLIFP